jgi:hypothetical protein
MDLVTHRCAASRDRRGSGVDRGGAGALRRLRALGGVALLAAAAGCARPKPTSPPQVSQVEWSVSRDRLAAIRDAEPKRPYSERVRVTIRDPRSGRTFEGRGGVAVSPGRAVRMMLLGPGGTTALDVWVTPERFRFIVPAIHFERRGGADPADARGLPIGMLRWWFLAPLSGRLLLARSTASESAFLLRDGRATIAARTDGRSFVAVRRDGEQIEGIEWLGRGLAPSPGARARYVDGTYGLRVDVVVEDVSKAEPEPGAFLDPDVGDTAL